MELATTEWDVDGDGVATVRLHRPGRGNSWTGRMHTEYRWIFTQLEADPSVRVAVVTGTPPHFCVGADTGALEYNQERGSYDTGLRDGVPEPGYGVRPEFDEDFVWQWGLRFPVIAAVNGGCAGAAMALMAFCDLRFGAAEAKLTTAAPKLGLPAELGLSWVLPRLCGVTAAADILLTGRTFTAAEAPAGLFNDVVPGDELDDLVASRARWIATQIGPEAVTATKRQLYSELLSTNPAESVAHSKSLIDKAMGGAEFAEGVAAFTEKRRPKF